jgi:hypothetical protein
MFLDDNETGQEKLNILKDNLDNYAWSDQEAKILISLIIKNTNYGDLDERNKKTIMQIFAKYAKSGIEEGLF